MCAFACVNIYWVNKANIEQNVIKKDYKQYSLLIFFVT